MFNMEKHFRNKIIIIIIINFKKVFANFLPVKYISWLWEMNCVLYNLTVKHTVYFLRLTNVTTT